ncbi:uncharacterized protein V6R79_019944 [Siganus canaliculatus]
MALLDVLEVLEVLDVLDVLERFASRYADVTAVSPIRRFAGLMPSKAGGKRERSIRWLPDSLLLIDSIDPKLSYPCCMVMYRS